MKKKFSEIDYISQMSLYKVNLSAGAHAGVAVAREVDAFTGIANVTIISGTGGATEGTIKVQTQIGTDGWVDHDLVDYAKGDLVQEVAFTVGAGETATIQQGISQFEVPFDEIRVLVTTTAGEVDAVAFGEIFYTNLDRSANYYG